MFKFCVKLRPLLVVIFVIKLAPLKILSVILMSYVLQRKFSSSTSCLYVFV